MDEKSDKHNNDKPLKSKKPLKKRIIKTILFLVYVLVIAEIASRVYWKTRRNVPFFSDETHWYNRFYDELQESNVFDADLSENNGTFDVLLLGGSALDRVDDSLAEKSQVIQQDLEKITHQPVKIYNLARPGMTTRDSLIKYRLLEEKHFDLVIIYHGVNDTRLNNCPPDMFKSDYTHSGWYHKINLMEKQRAMLPYFSLPYTLQYSFVHILTSKKLDYYIPRHRIKPEWTQYGSDVKTAVPFEKNLTKIIKLADSKDEPVVLLTFCWYVPENYSMDALREKKLDYADSPAPSPVELWGTIEGVTAGLEKHNEVIRHVAKDNPKVFFADADVIMPKEGKNYNDVCHLSEKGKKELLNVILPLVEKLTQQAESQPAKSK